MDTKDGEELQELIEALDRRLKAAAGGDPSPAELGRRLALAEGTLAASAKVLHTALRTIETRLEIVERRTHDWVRLLEERLAEVETRGR